MALQINVPLLMYSDIHHLTNLACLPQGSITTCQELHDCVTQTVKIGHAACGEWGCFLQGFCAAVSLDVLQAYIVRPQDLTAMVSGSSTSWQAITGIQDVFHIVLDHQLQTEFQDLVTCLWEVS